MFKSIKNGFKKFFINDKNTKKQPKQIESSNYQQKEKPEVYSNFITNDSFTIFTIGHLTFNLQSLKSQHEIIKKRQQIKAKYTGIYMKGFYNRGQLLTPTANLALQFLCVSQWKYVVKTTQKSYARVGDAIITKSFWQITFKNLITLDISQHKIVSIEGIAHMQIPNLKKLILIKNSIRNINILSKTLLNQLQVIQIYNNPVVQYKKFSRGSFKGLNKFQIDKQPYSDYQNPIQDVTFLFKALNFDKINELWIQNSKRVQNYWFIQQMKLKVTK